MRDLDLQAHVVETGKEVFGEANMTDCEERALRFTEEALELIRACGVRFETVAAMLAHEYYCRQIGHIPQEIAGTHSTLLSLADSLDIDARIVTLKECDRVLANKEACRAKHNAKPEMFARKIA